MANRTVNVRGYRYEAWSNAPTTIWPARLFTFTYNPGVRYDHDIRGITHDGKQLYFSTGPSTSGTARAARLLTVDPVAGSIQREVEVATGSDSWIEDIVHCPWNKQIYAIRWDGSVSWTLILIKPETGAYHTLGNLNSNARAIAWDAGRIYVNHWTSAFGFPRTRVYDPATGTEVMASTNIQTPSIAQDEGWGLVHTGQNIVYKADPTLFALRTFYTVDPIAHSAGPFHKIQQGQAVAASGEQSTITYDGGVLWEFDMA
jgi:hypothetical protein